MLNRILNFILDISNRATTRHSFNESLYIYLQKCTMHAFLSVQSSRTRRVPQSLTRRCHPCCSRRWCSRVSRKTCAWPSNSRRTRRSVISRRTRIHSYPYHPLSQSLLDSNSLSIDGTLITRVFTLKFTFNPFAVSIHSSLTAHRFPVISLHSERVSFIVVEKLSRSIHTNTRFCSICPVAKLRRYTSGASRQSAIVDGSCPMWVQVGNTGRVIGKKVLF